MQRISHLLLSGRKNISDSDKTYRLLINVDKEGTSTGNIDAGKAKNVFDFFELTRV